ncbi:MAG: Ig-like domain-containing protein [Candidatus Alcyoniella australis]|nr:Ig-like domain-containing protein [Candidatus Alcyoniella australis]
MLILLLAAVLALAVCCTGDNKTPYNAEDDDDSTDDDDDQPEPPDPPDVDPVISPTPLLVQSISGTAEVDAAINVRGGAQSASATADNIGGEWCVTVSLNQATSNDLEITATDREGNISDPALVSIVQDPNSGPEEQNLSLEGLAFAGSTSGTECPECTADKGIDGSTATWWHNSTNTFHEEARRLQWYGVKRLDTVIVKRAVIVWQASMFATDYVVYYSDLPSPPDPHEDGALEEPNWYVAHVEQMGTGGTQYIDFDEPFTARWVAIVLFEGSDINELTGRARYAIAEFEIYGVSAEDWPVDPGC